MNAPSRVSPLPGPFPLDLDTVIATLYVGGLDPEVWYTAGPARMAAYVTAVATDPRCRMPELVALVNTARQAGPPWVLADYLADVEAFAPAVVAVLGN